MKNKWMILLALVLVFVGCGNEPKKPGPTANNRNNQNNQNNENNAAQCGDGVLQPGELCDSAISDAEGACPTSCAAPACSTATLQGAAADCTAECLVEPIACQNGDGCCPVGCDLNSDDDCTNLCGDGMVEEPETCDGDCPASCDDNDACTTDELVGDASTCSVVCRARIINVCQNDDGCCPAGCTENDDNDCTVAASCGDDTLDPGELCDGDCPTSCSDNEGCTLDQLVGSAATCDARCIFTPIDACNNNDGCCATGCTSANDNDCTCTPRTCAGEGYVCGDFPNGCNGTISCGVCNPGTCSADGQCVGLGEGEVGDSCSVNEDCYSDPAFPLAIGQCLVEGYPGGYCTRICIAPFIDCGPGAICDMNAQTCLKLCTNSNQCRAGYTCQAIIGGSACLPS